MKPKTKLDFRVTELKLSLPLLNLKQKEWAIDTMFQAYAAQSRKTVYCLDCGTTWKTETQSWHNQITGANCPDCGKELKMVNHNGDFKIREQFSLITYKEDFQVQRIYEVTKYMKKKTKPEYYFHEVIQHWIRTDGKKKTLNNNYGNSYYGSAFNYSSGLEVRSGEKQIGYGGYNGYANVDNMNPAFTYPKKRYHPILKRNGVREVHDVIPYVLYHFLFKDNFAETLIKLKQDKFLSFYVNKALRGDDSDYLKDAIQTCLKNKYRPVLFSDWYDLVKVQQYFGRDLKNAKYVCPDNLRAEHDRLMERKRNVERKRAALELIKAMEKNEIEYTIEKRKFFGLHFVSGDIEIKVLESVADFKKEASAHRHCIFTNEYYKNKNSLCFSATYKGIQNESIEVDLRTMKVAQARGIKNRGTAQNKEILALMDANLYQIKKALKPKNKTVKTKLLCQIA